MKFYTISSQNTNRSGKSLCKHPALKYNCEESVAFNIKLQLSVTNLINVPALIKFSLQFDMPNLIAKSFKRIWHEHIVGVCVFDF